MANKGKDETIKRIDIKEFRELGYLQEINRLFLHPLGMALEVIVNDEDDSEILGGIWDYREDEEGMFFGKDIVKNKRIETVENLRASKVATRVEIDKKYNGIKTDDNGVQIL